MPRLAVTAVLAALACALPASATEIRERTTYFMVQGSTLEELDRQLQERGPSIGGASRHPGATSVRFDGHVTYEAGDGWCKVDETHLSLDLEMTLPRWRSRFRASAETALIWRTLERDIRRHEQEHAEIAKEWLARMESGLRVLKPRRNCAAMERAVNAATREYLRKHEAAQNAFDTREGREASQRLRRALRDNRYGGQ
ncbi:DUF922 domain-containing protein [Aureimonas mangrovi]|uniref:DUF922 domain-containing protein n=1 Tax=Aureimonas mangrovi TaxID=2758041 RepID=UPI00163DC501|nr:DUF922 domain-containing protein [Aureimonas mangrovi]